MKSILSLILILMVISLILVFNWFRDGYVLGTAESQISFYNLTRFFNAVKLSWSDTNPGLGFANGIVTSYAPSFFILSVLQNFGIPTFIIEAWVFWFFLVTSGFGIILFTQELFPKISRKYLLIAALFYWFNLLSLVNIWNRFLYNYIALWALLPLVSAFYIKGLNKRNYLYVFAVGITCVVLSLGLSNPVFNIILWFHLTYLTLFKFFTARIAKDKFFFVVFLILNLTYFCLVNLWWIGQVVKNFFLGKYTEEISIFFQNDVSLSTLTASSKNMGDIIDLFRLFHKPFFTTPQIDWPKFFSTPSVAAIEFLITGIILLFIFRARKNINVILLAVLLLIGIYLAKGNNPPFGKLFQFLFTIITPLQFFRNPFEKFGFLLPLAFVPLFAAALEDLSSRFQKKIRMIIYLVCFIIVIVLYGYPFWSGLVFTGFFPPTNDYSVGYKVQVPKYYEEASSWLESEGNNFRFIGFPFNGQGVTYDWEKGYQGIETSMWLFSTPHIMFSTTALYFDRVADQLEKVYVKNADFYEVMNILNAKYLMVRSDVDFHERNMKDPQKIKDIAEKKVGMGKLTKSLSFGKLEFWENPFWSDKTIYATTNLINISPSVRLNDFTLSDVSSAGSAVSNISYLNELVELEVIHPTDLKNSDRKPGYYKFDIKNRGKYELISDSLIRADEILVEGAKIQSNPILREDGKWSYGNLDLSEGSHPFQINTQLSENVVALSDNQDSFTISDFDPFSKYFISFEYSTAENKKLIIVFDSNQIVDGQLVPYHVRELPTTFGNRIESFKELFDTRSTASSVRILFSPDTSSLKINNLSIKKQIIPELILIKKSENKVRKAPNLSYNKISPTKYLIHIENSQNPFILVFSSTFNKGWQVTYPDGTKVNEHFLANSFANGWLIDKLGEYELTLNYVLQADLNRDSAVSVASLVFGSIVIILGTYFKKFS